MMYAMFSSHAMSQGASAHQAEASSCAHCAAHTAIRVILDAIIMASIIICGLIISLRAIALIAILVLVVGLIIQEVNTPWCNELAI